MCGKGEKVEPGDEEWCHSFKKPPEICTHLNFRWISLENHILYKTRKSSWLMMVSQFDDSTQFCLINCIATGRLLVDCCWILLGSAGFNLYNYKNCAEIQFMKKGACHGPCRKLRLLGPNCPNFRITPLLQTKTQILPWPCIAVGRRGSCPQKF